MIFYIVLIFNYIFIPIYQVVTDVKLEPVNLPAELWTVFGVGFIGYGYLRTVEKTGQKVPKLNASQPKETESAKG